MLGRLQGIICVSETVTYAQVKRFISEQIKHFTYSKNVWKHVHSNFLLVQQ